jgi:undecaprenyl-diphosphatase
MLIFVLGNIIAFVVAIVAIRFFISLIEKFGFRIWGWYRIVVGVILILLFTI